MLPAVPSTMGNHDFDNGIEGFKKMLPHSNFPFLCSNYDFSNTILNGETKTHLVKEIDGIKVGLLGVGIELNGLVEKSQFKETKYLDPIEQANYYAKKLKEDYRCDLIICLSHLGYSYNSGKISDLVLASKSENINISLGGHTHSISISVYAGNSFTETRDLAGAFSSSNQSLNTSFT